MIGYMMNNGRHDTDVSPFSGYGLRYIRDQGFMLSINSVRVFSMVGTTD